MMQQPLRAKRPSRQEISQSASTPAPVAGWNTRDPLASMAPTYAILLDNWLPSAGSAAVRPGATAFATGLLAPVKTLMPWKGTSGEKLFAATDAGIYEITAGGAVGAAVLARTNGYHSILNYTTTGGSFLVMVNGADDYTYYNGTTWTTVPTFAKTGGGTLDTNTLQSINSFKRALYFIPKTSMSFWYLPIDSITGTVSEFPLGALFNKGGSLLAMATWTLDGGLGSDDYSVFITDQGQAAVYLGTDPSSSTTWALRGVYDLAPPMGIKCFCKFGADLLILTRRGVFSMTKVLQDSRVNDSGALSDVIGEAFTQASSLSGGLEGWQVFEYPEANVLLCNIPITEYGTSYQFVMNTKTRAWCRFKGWDCYDFAFFGNKLYGALNGKVGEMFKPGNDFDASITAEAKTAFNYFAPRSRIKAWAMVRPNLSIAGSIAVNVAMDTDFASDGDFGAAVFNISGISRWDAARWDENVWAEEAKLRLEWVTVSAKNSYCAATRLRVIARDATIVWSATDTLYEVGALV